MRCLERVIASVEWAQSEAIDLTPMETLVAMINAGQPGPHSAPLAERGHAQEGREVVCPWPAADGHCGSRCVQSRGSV